MTQKQCNHCYEVKPITEFSQKSTTQCKKCRNKTNKAYYQKTNAVYNTASAKKGLNQETQYKEKGVDDYSNHFLSHFGFFDIAPDADRAIKNGLPIGGYASSNGVTLTESTGLR